MWSPEIQCLALAFQTRLISEKMIMKTKAFDFPVFGFLKNGLLNYSIRRYECAQINLQVNEVSHVNGLV